MAAQFNFFSWIREGVKHSVMMGVADALEDLGAPPNQDEAASQVMRFLTSSEETKALPATAGSTRRGGSQKRLGRSLKDVAAET